MDWGSTRLEIVPIGTGEGLERSFAVGKRDGETGYQVIRTTWRVLFVAREIDQIAAITSRRGATLSATLSQMYSGEELGHANADAERRVIIPRHSYRAALTMGVRPGRGAVLLDDADGGLPQRVFWMPATDPDIPAAPPRRHRPSAGRSRRSLGPPPMKTRHPRSWMSGRVPAGPSSARG
jgi:hypothetical protein